MSLDAPLTPLEGRGHPNVGAGGVNVLSDAHEPGIHPPARDDHGRVGEHVRGREADALPSPVPDDHLTSQDVGSTQQPAGLLHFAPGYERPDAGRAYTALSVFAPDGHRMGLSTERPHEAPEIPSVARRPVAEPEVLPYHDDLGPDLADEHLPDDLLGTLLRKLLIEPDLPHLIHPVPEQSLPPELQRRE